RTASRRDSALASVPRSRGLAESRAPSPGWTGETPVAPLAIGSGSGDDSSMAGAADPMMTTLALDPPVGCVARAPSPANAVASPDDSALGVPLRAESAANGETEFDRADTGGSARRASVGDACERERGEARAGVRTGLGAGRAGPVAAASLSNCSIGNRRCAWAIF